MLLRDGALAALAVSLTACSLFSGWSDLEGGACHGACDAGADAMRAGADADVEAGDAALISDGGRVPTPGVSCGSVQCDVASGMGCCVTGAGPGTCGNPTQCATSGFFIGCDTSAQCPGGEVCCFQIGLSNGASCQASCGSGTPLCSPQTPGDCPAPKQCTLGALPPGYYTCQ